MKKQEKYIQKIVDQIMISANLGGLPEAEEQIFKKNMEAQIIRRLGLIITQNLDNTGLQEYEKLIKKGRPKQDDFQKFLEKYAPDYEKKAKEGMKKFMNEVMIAAMK